jgi:hypothetical protein
MNNHIEEDHALECAFCFLRFDGFAKLAQHVDDAHVSPADRRTKLPTIESTLDEWGLTGEEMLPAPGTGKRESERGNTGIGSGGSRKPPAVPFLKVEDLSKDPKTAKILAVATKDTGFNDLIVKVAISGRSYFFGLKASNPNYEALFNAFGGDENDWIGEEFTVGLNWNEFYEKSFVHVFSAQRGDKPKRKSRS